MASVNWFANVFLVSMASTMLGVVADWLGKELVFVIGVAVLWPRLFWFYMWATSRGFYS
jgi:hypothetical protein